MPALSESGGQFRPAQVLGMLVIDRRARPAKIAYEASQSRAGFSSFLCCILNGMSADQRSQDPELLRRLLRAKDRMDAASEEEWPVRRLARVSGVSEAHFARSFKQAFGVPPHRYLLTRRVERATALLRDTDLSVSEIAFLAGWGSLGTFGRTFRDVTGESPGAVRVRERAVMQALDRVPPCFLSAAQRPHLTIAVSEKRRQVSDGMNGSEQTEVP
jgi:transcriptional regulator GlxA family with amidase domain